MAMMLHINGEKPPSGEKTKQKLMAEVLSSLVSSEIFLSLHGHIFDAHPLHDHRVWLIKEICSQYFTIELFHAGKRFTHHMQGDKVQSVLNKAAAPSEDMFRG